MCQAGLIDPQVFGGGCARKFDTPSKISTLFPSKVSEKVCHQATTPSSQRRSSGQSKVREREFKAHADIRLWLIRPKHRVHSGTDIPWVCLKNRLNQCHLITRPRTHHQKRTSEVWRSTRQADKLFDFVIFFICVHQKLKNDLASFLIQRLLCPFVNSRHRTR